ncbi:MAG: 5,10-methylenetetrahydrofolate reductase, partial [Thermoplasmata archaeon]
LQKDRHILRSYRRELQRAKKVLVLSCGNGVQVISEILHNIEVVSGTDTLFLGEIRHANDFEKRCMMCGECIIDVFESMCPISRCPKHMLNGPCGGSRNGKCEVYPELDCIWFLIYNRLIERGKVLLYKKIQEPKDWSKSLEMRRILE